MEIFHIGNFGSIEGFRGGNLCSFGVFRVETLVVFIYYPFGTEGGVVYQPLPLKLNQYFFTAVNVQLAVDAFTAFVDIRN